MGLEEEVGEEEGGGEEGTDRVGGMEGAAGTEEGEEASEGGRLLSPSGSPLMFCVSSLPLFLSRVYLKVLCPTQMCAMEYAHES